MNEEIEAYYTPSAEDGFIRVVHGDFTQREFTDLDIRDAVFLRYQLDGAISDYERAVGK